MQDDVLAQVAPLRGLTPEELSEARTAAVPLARDSTPDECAGLVWFLLSEEASYMTGQSINFSGGLVTW
jgi:NAD(P)-dependent dehydrogenase (short-subunit alcohol dehydrogenase family)